MGNYDRIINPTGPPEPSVPLPTPIPQLQISKPIGGAQESGIPKHDTQAKPADTLERLDNALKNTGVKAEIKNEPNGDMIVRLVQSDTGVVVMQLPPQGVIDLISDFEKRHGQHAPAPVDPENSGIMIDRFI